MNLFSQIQHQWKDSVDTENNSGKKTDFHTFYCHIFKEALSPCYLDTLYPQVQEDQATFSPSGSRQDTSFLTHSKHSGYKTSGHHLGIFGNSFRGEEEINLKKL